MITLQAILFPHVPRMMLQYLPAERRGINVGIDLRRADALVTKQYLYHPQIGTTFE